VRLADIALSVYLYMSVGIGMGTVVAVLGIGSVLNDVCEQRKRNTRSWSPPENVQGRGEMALWKAVVIRAASSSR